jgi:hypothetical protein
MKIVELRQGDRRYEIWVGQGETINAVFMHKIYSTNLIERANKKINLLKAKGYSTEIEEESK